MGSGDNLPVLFTESEVLGEVVARTLKVWPHVQKILLFGSRARGDARPDSDFDILIVVPDLPVDTARTTRLRLALRGLGAAFDIVALTPAEFADLQQSADWHARDLLASAREVLRAA
jgi:predicted nucleotidyltransferase